MKGFFKKSTALVLALMMVLSMFTGMIFTANAETEVTFNSYTYDFSQDLFGGESTVIDANGMKWQKQDGVAITDGQLVMSGNQLVALGDENLDNYVLEFDVAMSQIAGVVKGTTGGCASWINVVSDEFSKKNQGFQCRLFPSTVKDNGNNAGSTTVGTNFANDSFNLQLNTTAQSNSTYSYINMSEGLTTSTAFDATKTHRVRIEVIGGAIKFLIKEDGSDSWLHYYSVTGFEGKTGTINFYTDAAVKWVIDNLSIALLNTANVPAGSATFNVPNTVVATGTKDADLGITYGQYVDFEDVLGGAVNDVWFGAEFAVVADGYDVSKPGIRKATVKSGTATQQVDIVYTTDVSAYSVVDFDDNAVPDGWTATATVEISDGKAHFDAASEFLYFNTKVSDIVLSYDMTIESALTNSIFLSTVRSGKNASVIPGSAYECGNVKNAWRIYERTEIKDLYQKSSTPASAVNSTYHVTITAVGQNCSMQIYDVTNPSEVATITYPTTTKINSEGYVIFGFQAFEDTAKVAIDNISVHAVNDFDDQSAYGVSVTGTVGADYELATGTFSNVTGTVSANYYGFKASELSDLANYDMYYNGDGTAIARVGGKSITVPCNVTYPESSITVEGGLVDGSAKVGQVTVPYTNYTVEYDFTPYFTNYLANPTVQLYIPSSNGKNYEIAVFYQGLSTTSNEIDDTIDGKEYWPYGVYPTENGQGTSWGANYIWRLYGRNTSSTNTNQTFTHTPANGPAPVANTVYNGNRDELTTDGLSKVTEASLYYALAEKLTEGVVTYKIQVTVLDGDLSFKVKTSTDDTAWSEIQPIATAKDANLAANPTIYFHTVANGGRISAEAQVDNIVVTDLATHNIASISADSAAVELGTSADELAFTATTASGYSFDMIGAQATVTGYDANKAGVQDVTITVNGVSGTKRVIVSENSIAAFENFSTYTDGETTYSDNTKDTADHTGHGHAIQWNTYSLAVTDGVAYGLSSNSLIQGVKSVEGTVGMDITVPAETRNTNMPKMLALGKFNSKAVSFAIITTSETVETGKAYAAITYCTAQDEANGESDVLAMEEIDFAFDTTYRLELRVYGNTVKGVIDGKNVVSYSFATDLPTSEIYKHVTADSARFGIFANTHGALATKLGVEQVGNLAFYVDNVLKTNSVAAYTVTNNAGATNTLPTKAQAGDKVYVTADVNRNGALKANDYNVFINKDTMHGDWSKNTPGGAGDTFMFVMPAEDVVLTINDNEALAEGEYSIATGATSIKKFYNKETNEFEKYGVRFLNRLYLPGITSEGAKLGNVSAFGALLLPVDLLDGATTLTIDDVAVKNAYDAKAYGGEKTQIYNITAKYIDYIAVVKTSDANRQFICVPYAVVDGEYVYGDAMIGSYN